MYQHPEIVPETTLRFQRGRRKQQDFQVFHLEEQQSQVRERALGAFSLKQPLAELV